MPSILNSHFTPELNAMDSAFGEVIDRLFALDDKYFYTPKPYNDKNAESKNILIANTFDIDISNKSPFVAEQLLQKPLLSKQKLGTMQGIKEVLNPIFGDLNIATHATDKSLKPFNYTINILPQSHKIADIKLAKELISTYKPLRDHDMGINIKMPQAQIPLEIATTGRINLHPAKTSQMSLALEQEYPNFSVVAKWDLSL